MFLFDRAFTDCLDRLRDISRPFERALLIGCPSPAWPDRLKAYVCDVDAVDPGPQFAERADGRQAEEDRYDFGEARYDLCVAVGTLDTVNDLPLALRHIRRALRPDAPLIGALSGGNSLAALRASFIEAGRAGGKVVARTHPRIDPATLARLLAAAGYSMAVVDVDRVTLRYASLYDLVRDLRAMGATSVLAQHAPPLSKSGAAAVLRAYSHLANDGRTDELIEILHFLCWSQ